MSLTDAPEFLAALPYLERGTYNHARYELAPDTPVHIRTMALGLEVGCCRCNRRIHPFRERAAPASRGWKVGAIYLAYSCELDYDKGCARSGAARTVSAKIAKMIADAPKPPAQGALI